MGRAREVRGEKNGGCEDFCTEKGKRRGYGEEGSLEKSRVHLQSPFHPANSKDIDRV